MSSFRGSILPLISPILSHPFPAASPAGFGLQQYGWGQRTHRDCFQPAPQLPKSTPCNKIHVYSLQATPISQSGFDLFHTSYCFSVWTLSHWYRYFGKWPLLVDWSWHISYLLFLQALFLDPGNLHCNLWHSKSVSSAPREKNTGCDRGWLESADKRTFPTHSRQPGESRARLPGWSPGASATSVLCDVGQVLYPLWVCLLFC